ncbi:MAG: indole-3-glycerol-phosphate synthase TrpC, partial [Bacteroidetes bacterium]|nr:indole-3-glycerol-phosphate synthase TrpC [Bacteroidota bacterium]
SPDPFITFAAYSLAERILNSTEPCVIAEFKRRSPSKGLINGEANVSKVVKGYKAGGASAVSVLTDQKYFQGSDGDLLVARKSVDIPILRKEFIIDEYQLVEAKAIGADVIL